LVCHSAAEVSVVLSALPQTPGGQDFEADSLTWEEAQLSAHSEDWCVSFQEELASLKHMGVYELVPHSSVPTGTRIHHRKPVFHVKWDAQGCIYQ
jgi:hypothetical protein